jgi:hypothetical protein
MRPEALLYAEAIYHTVSQGEYERLWHSCINMSSLQPRISRCLPLAPSRLGNEPFTMTYPQPMPNPYRELLTLTRRTGRITSAADASLALTARPTALDWLDATCRLPAHSAAYTSKVPTSTPMGTSPSLRLTRRRPLSTSCGQKGSTPSVAALFRDAASNNPYHTSRRA